MPRILVVDDDPHVARTLVDLLALHEYKAERAESGVTGPEVGEAQDTGAPTGMWEWFSPSRGRTVTSAPKTRPAPDPPDDWVLLTDVEPDARPE